MRQPTRTQLKKKADRLFSLRVRLKGYCEKCASTKNLQCAHIFSRRYLATRWDEANALCLCQACHMFFTPRPIQFEDWVRAYIGNEKYEEVRQRALGLGKPDYEEILARLSA